MFTIEQSDIIQTQCIQIKVYMGEGWHLEFGLSHFDFYSPPDLYVKVRNRMEPKNQLSEMADKRL